MLRPTKHANPDQTVMRVATLLISYLGRHRIETYPKLLAHVKKSVHGGQYLFAPALNVLFLLGLVDYRQKTDSLEYLGPS